MNQTTSTNDSLNFDGDPPKLSSGLNVLTILTFIGCGLGALFMLLMPVLNDFAIKAMDKAVASGQELSAKRLAEMEKARAAIELYKHNAVPLLIVGAIGVILCFVGALWMRKLKKDGYWLYVAGELAPLAGSAIIMGTGQYESIWSILFGIGIPVLFVILYTMQRKYLVR
jgi:uncharacterized membrane protein YgdD (TMEM256/DUF423 family)